MTDDPRPDSEPAPQGQVSLRKRIARTLFGSPLKLTDRAIFHQITLISLLAWIGLGSDALSSSCYGPAEAMAVIKGHPHLAVALALATAATVFLISSAYSRLIELFPNGGGYGVASRLLGPRIGMISGCALLIDYALTISVSVTASGLAIFSLFPLEWFAGGGALALGDATVRAAAEATRSQWMIGSDIAVIMLLIGLNLRGLRESILVLTPIFLLFVITHLILLVAGFVFHLPQVQTTATSVSQSWTSDLATIGMGGMVMLLLHAYAMGGGTYTGIEAVSNALPMMREPRLQTAKRTMNLMAVSLAVTAGGLILCYLLWDVPAGNKDKTMNALLAESVAAHLPFGKTFVILTLVSEAALLLVAAQTGFIGGPRVLANLAVDSWMPRRFAALSERLTIGNGIALMGVAAIAMILISRGDIAYLIVIYAITVFLSFALTMAGMALLWFRRREERWLKIRRAALFTTGFVVCAVILIFTAIKEWNHGGLLAVVLTLGIAGLCLLIRSHYQRVNRRIAILFEALNNIPRTYTGEEPVLDRTKPTAVVLVGAFGGLGLHTVLNIFRSFPGHYRNLVFVSVGVMDSGEMKGEDTIDELRERTEAQLAKYRELATGLGFPSSSRLAIGTDAAEEATNLCLSVAKEFPRATFFAGKVIFRPERWYHWLLHNDTAYVVQKRLHWQGRTMVVLPARIT